MSKITFYGYKKCSTCRNAEKALVQAGVEYHFIDITEKSPSAETLKDAAKQAGLPLLKLFNTSGVQYQELGLKDKVGSMSEAQILKLLSSNGRLVKRPLVTDGKKSTVGFKAEDFSKTWSR